MQFFLKASLRLIGLVKVLATDTWTYICDSWVAFANEKNYLYFTLLVPICWNKRNKLCPLIHLISSNSRQRHLDYSHGGCRLQTIVTKEDTGARSHQSRRLPVTHGIPPIFVVYSANKQQINFWEINICFEISVTLRRKCSILFWLSWGNK